MNYINLFVFFVLAVLVLVSIYNYIYAERIAKNTKLFCKKKLLKNTNLVICIPVRNEQENLPKLLISLYKLLEFFPQLIIYILDDNSTDKTSEILRGITSDRRISIHSGKPLKKGYLGKNWACFQLAQLAQISKPNFLLFIDADVQVTVLGLLQTIDKALSNKADFLSVFPKQEMTTIGEKVSVSYINWILLSMLPIKLSQFFKSDMFVTANGQFLLFSNQTYMSLNPHSVVKAEIAEDIEIAKLINKSNYKSILAIAESEIVCRMYNSWLTSIFGLSKNASKLFLKNNDFIYLGIIVILVLANLYPFILIFTGQANIGLLMYLLIVINKIIVSKMSGQKILDNVILQIPMIINLFIISVMSVTNNFGVGHTWKNRKAQT